MWLTVQRGSGYVPADKNKQTPAVIGLIPIDLIYTPIRGQLYG